MFKLFITFTIFFVLCKISLIFIKKFVSNAWQAVYQNDLELAVFSYWIFGLFFLIFFGLSINLIWKNIILCSGYYFFIPFVYLLIGLIYTNYKHIKIVDSIIKNHDVTNFKISFTFVYFAEIALNICFVLHAIVLDFICCNVSIVTTYLSKIKDKT